MLPTILCVDDEVSGLRLRAGILEFEGFKVLTATTRERALEIFRSETIDAVVSDHLLGRHTGTDMAHEMKRIKPEVPILIVSGSLEVPSDLDSADMFLSKLEGPEQIVSCVKQLLERPAVLPKNENSTLERAYEELRISQARLAGIVASTMDAIITIDEQQRIVLFNSAAERIFGYRSNQIIGQPLDRLIPENVRAAHRLHIRKFGETGVTTRSMYSPRMLSGLRAGGEEFPIEATISQVEAAGQKLYTVVLRDITERKLAEEELRKSERLAVAGRMAATVAHEINNPLESIANALYLIGRSPTLDENSRMTIRVAQEELKRVVQITKLTLGLSRAGERIETLVAPVQVIEGILLLYGRKLESLGVQIEKRYETNRSIRGIEGEVRQIFSNLIVNAADALATVGNRLIIRVEDSFEWRDITRKGIRVSIADNGSGISPPDQRYLFEPFYSTKGQKGTGLGLWVSLGIVKKHGGSLRVKSSTVAGKSGTVMSVFIPELLLPDGEGSSKIA